MGYIWRLENNLEKLVFSLCSDPSHGTCQWLASDWYCVQSAVLLNCLVPFALNHIVLLYAPSGCAVELGLLLDRTSMFVHSICRFFKIIFANTFTNYREVINIKVLLKAFPGSGETA